MTRHIMVSGYNKHIGMSGVSVEAIAADGRMIDCYRMESAILTFEELYAKHGRKAVRFFKSTYGITDVMLPKMRLVRAA